MSGGRRWWVGASRPPAVSLVSDESGRGSVVVEPPEPPDEHGDDAATIYDESTETEYRVTVARKGKGDPYLTSLRVIAPHGGKVTRGMLADADPAALALAAQQYVDRARVKPDEWVVVQPRELRPVRGELPDLAALADRVTGGATLAALTDEYGVSRATVSRWIAAAREAGHLPPATTGRGNRKTSTSKATSKTSSARTARGQRKGQSK